MDIFIVCNDQSISTRLRSCLQKLGIECPLSRIVSHESAEHILSAPPAGNAPVLLLFGSQQLEPHDLSTLEQLCASAGERFKVVAVGGTFGASAILQAVRSGAVDCLSLTGNVETEIRHLLDRLEAAHGERARVGRLFTVIGAVGGTGASVLAANLAAALAQRQQKCGLLDLHWRGGDQAALLNSTPRHTLLSLAGKTEHLDRIMLEQSLVRHECGVHLLASPEPFNDYRQIRPELVQKIVQLARSIYSSVVVDLEDCEHHDQVRTLAASEQIIVVLRLDFVSLVRTKKLLNYLLAASVAREHISVVANQTGQPNELPVSQVEEALGMPIQHRVPHDRAAVNAAINLGVPLVIGCPHSKAAIGIVRLAESLLGIAVEPLSKTWTTGMLPLKSMACLFGAVSTQSS